MKINNDHLFHGAALAQIAEHPRFTAINAFADDTTVSRSAFKINAEIGLYLKYATKPKKPYSEYTFTFSTENRDELVAIGKRSARVFLALVCVDAREICCIPLSEFDALIATRKKAKQSDEEQYSLIVTVPKGKSIRVYVNTPGKKGRKLGESTVPRKNFPGILFSPP